MYFYETAQPKRLVQLPVTKPVRSAVPTFEPVTIREARTQCELGNNDSHDTHLLRLIAEAREAVEEDTGIVACTGTYTWKLSEFPEGEVLTFPLRPVTSITSITYVDTGGTPQTWASTNYALHTSGVNPFLGLVYDQDWPTYRGDINGITITFVAGYANEASVPQLFKQAVLLHIRKQWQDLLGEMADDWQAGYERMIRRLMRSSYP